LYRTIFLAVTLATAVYAGTVDVVFEGAGISPVGGWGNTLSSGLAGGIQLNWLFSSKFRGGIGIEGATFGDGNSGSASFSHLKPMGILSFYLRPNGASFNPGVVAAFGYCRSRLSSEGGIDPASWDPFWRAGIRWNFSLGSPWRAGLGFDLESVIASEKSGDAFRFTFGVSREVQL
jgi:hypothetical protein